MRFLQKCLTNPSFEQDHNSKKTTFLNTIIFYSQNYRFPPIRGAADFTIFDAFDFGFEVCKEEKTFSNILYIKLNLFYHELLERC